MPLCLARVWASRAVRTRHTGPACRPWPVQTPSLDRQSVRLAVQQTGQLLGSVSPRSGHGELDWMPGLLIASVIIIDRSLVMSESPSLMFLFDIDACGFVEIVHAGVFDDVQQAATAWRVTVRDTAEDARPERVETAPAPWACGFPRPRSEDEQGWLELVYANTAVTTQVDDGHPAGEGVRVRGQLVGVDVGSGIADGPGGR